MQEIQCQEYFCLCTVSNLKGFNAFVLDSLLLCPLVQLQVEYWLRLSENEKWKTDLFSHSTAPSHAFTSNLACIPLSVVQVQIRHLYLSRQRSLFLGPRFLKNKMLFAKKVRVCVCVWIYHDRIVLIDLHVFSAEYFLTKLKIQFLSHNSHSVNTL